MARYLLGAALALLVVALACGPAATATPTTPAGAPTPTATRFVPQVPGLPSPTPTLAAGVTAQATPTATPIPAEQPKRGGILNMASSGAHTVDPLRAIGSNWSGLAAASNVWGQLIRVSPKDRVTVEPDMAESWTISPDGKEWKFKLRSGIVDHEGNPFTAQEAYYTMVRYIERPNALLATRQACIRSYVKKAWDANKQPLPAGQAGAEATGPMELTLRLTAPGMGFVPCFSAYPVVMQPTKYVKAIDSSPDGKTRDLDPTKGEFVGYGPFKLKEIKVDSHLFVVRNDKYFKPGLPYLDEIQWITMPEQSTWEAALSIGKLDIGGNGVGPSTMTRATRDAMQKQLGDKIKFHPVLAMGIGGFDVNVRRAPFGPVGDPKADKVRTAMQLYIDRAEINDLVLDGTGHLATPYFIGWSWLYSEKEWLEQYRGFDSSPTAKARDRAEAKKLMEEAGYNANNRLKATIITGTSGTNNEWSQVVARQLRDIYMDITVSGLTNNTDVAKTGNNFEMNSFNNGTTFPDPDSYNTDINATWENGGQNSSGYTNPKLTELHAQQALMTSVEQRAPILRQMARIWHDDVTRIGLLRSTVLQAYGSHVKGWYPPPYHFIAHTFESVWLDRK